MCTSKLGPPKWLSGFKKNKPTCQCRQCMRDELDTWWGRSPRGGNGHPLQYSCLENAVDRGAWQATVLCVAKTGTRLSTHSNSSKLVYVNISDIF